MGIEITAAVEGVLDEAIIQRLSEGVGVTISAVYGKKGKQNLLARLTAYNAAARYSPWIVLVDLDKDADCAPPFVAATLKTIAPFMCFRVAVRAVEAWLMADRERMAEFLRISRKRIPENPDATEDPKKEIVNLARRSRSTKIQEALVPREGSGVKVGSQYTAEIMRFINDKAKGWRPEVASRRSDSLMRCLRCMRRIAAADNG